MTLPPRGGTIGRRWFPATAPAVFVGYAQGTTILSCRPTPPTEDWPHPGFEVYLFVPY